MTLEQKSFVITRERLALVSALLMLAGASIGCGNKQGVAWKQQQEWLKQSDALYQEYIGAKDLDEARHALNRMLAICENDQRSTPAVTVHGKFLAYARTYALEKLSGNEDRAEISLIKTRYWLVRQGELSEIPSSVIEESVRTFDGRRILEMVSKQDASHTGGKGPRYLEAITNRTKVN